MPEAIQRRTILYSSLPNSIFLPPPWAARAAGLHEQQARVRRGGQDAAAARFLQQVVVIEHADRSRAATGGSRSAPRSCRGSRRDEQPSFVKTGTTWLAKLIGSGASIFSAVTGTFTVLPSNVAVISAVPLASGNTRPFGSTRMHLRIGDAVGRGAREVDVAAIGPLAGEDQLRRVVHPLELERRRGTRSVR